MTNRSAKHNLERPTAEQAWSLGFGGRQGCQCHLWKAKHQKDHRRRGCRIAEQRACWCHCVRLALPPVCKIICYCSALHPQRCFKDTAVCTCVHLGLYGPKTSSKLGNDQNARISLGKRSGCTDLAGTASHACPLSSNCAVRFYPMMMWNISVHGVCRPVITRDGRTPCDPQGLQNRS